MLKLSSILWGKKLQNLNIKYKNSLSIDRKQVFILFYFIYSLYLKIIFFLHVSYLMLSYFTCFGISKNSHVLIVLQELCAWQQIVLLNPYSILTFKVFLKCSVFDKLSTICSKWFHHSIAFDLSQSRFQGFQSQLYYV